ncbi:hypothetical protein LY90DRAFT_504722 [Neocallimastix californiae]|uniref:Uncharacterized protein n=1 Tax=Neocallimastix californiae TaxID=1754190 RepID=A0A1Y2E591_9FUNG|nr:hypothetical protein LY90DRAFT_504722 [Neocallimastix californiae]|eukprot:ORY66682.1 hypothetical protein LY90DRAFT_504722 [Neocallimastix californiae]
MYINIAEHLVKNDSKLTLNKIEKRKYNKYWQGNDDTNENSYWQGNNDTNENSYWQGNNDNNKMLNNNMNNDNMNNNENENENWVNNNNNYWVDTNAKEKDSNNSNNYDYNNESNKIEESKSNGIIKDKNISYSETINTNEIPEATNTLVATSTLISSDKFNNSYNNIPDNSNISIVDNPKDNNDSNMLSSGLGLILPLSLVIVITAVMYIYKSKLFNNKENESNKSSKNITQNEIIETNKDYSSLPSNDSVLSREEMSYEIINSYQNIFPYTEKLHKDEATKPVQNL